MSQEIRAICFYSSLITHSSSLPFNLRWQISAGQLFELMLPVSFALTALLSTWVLASARKFRFSAGAVTLATLGTLFFPLITLPLYLIARSYRRRTRKASAKEEKAGENRAKETERQRLPLRLSLPLAYLIVMLSLGALYFYLDSRSVETHLMHANQVRVEGRRESVIAEYRAALRLEDDAHTHNLLGRELAAAQRYSEALLEFRVAEQMGEVDEELSYNIAVSLERLDRAAEAKAEYEKFLSGSLCQGMPHDARCTVARQRQNELAVGAVR